MYHTVRFEASRTPKVECSHGSMPMCNNTVAREQRFKLKRPFASNDLGDVFSKCCLRFRREMATTYHYSTTQIDSEGLRGLLLARLHRIAVRGAWEAAAVEVRRPSAHFNLQRTSTHGRRSQQRRPLLLCCMHQDAHRTSLAHGLLSFSPRIRQRAAIDVAHPTSLDLGPSPVTTTHDAAATSNSV